MLKPDHLARAEKSEVMLILIRTSDASAPCELRVKLSGRLRTRARMRSEKDGHAELYRLARLMDEESFATPPEQMFEIVRVALDDSPTNPMITDEE